MKRIVNHPILKHQVTKLQAVELVDFTVDGNVLQGYLGEPIAVALKANGLMVHRYSSRKHEPRGVFCAIGRCTDCVMIVDGVPNIRTCVTPLAANMLIQTQYGVSNHQQHQKRVDEHG